MALDTPTAAAAVVVPVVVTGSKARHYALTGGFLTRAIGCGQNVRRRLTDEQAGKYPHECRACTAAVAALPPAAPAPVAEEASPRPGRDLPREGRPAVVIPPPSNAPVAVARELRRLGLDHAADGDFRLHGHYLNGEREHTYVALLNAEARQTVADHADEIEGRLARGPFPFTVSLCYVDGRPCPAIHNGAAERIRETPPPAEGAAALTR